MGLKIGEITLPGALVNGENPQPFFRALSFNLACREDGTLGPNALKGYGVGCGQRLLPYRMQDRYSRNRTMVRMKTLVLENEHLVATFLPELGGKLWSLYSLDEQRELLFVNKVLQPANLAIRNAWTSGGIEWNLGHLGHSVFTCESLHCVALEDENAQPFLRMYEYEAIEKQVFQLDFHLPSGARQLGLHVRIENTTPHAAPLYWWTNTAVSLTPHTRVFSGTADILYQLPPDQQLKTPGFGRAKMPHQPTLPAVDISYPWRVPFSAEYFFQNSRECLPWEVSIQEDAKGFCERSTQPLFARKMFCWGTGVGGRNWCNYLSQPNQGDYIEIQAGLAPTQNHTTEITAGGIVRFTQMFGAFTASTGAAAGDWLDQLAGVEAQLDCTISQQHLLCQHARYEKLATLKGGTLLHRGTGYGGLERQRRQAAAEPDFAPHLAFEPPAKGEALYPWVLLLNGTPLPDTPLPLPYAPGAEWLPVLAASAKSQGENRQMLFQQAVLLAEYGAEPKARAILQQLVNLQHDPFAAHALGALEQRAGHASLAAEHFVLAYQLEQGRLDPSFAEDAMAALLKQGQPQAAWHIYEEIAPEMRSEAQKLLALEAALKLEHFDFLKTAFDREYANIREGSVGLTNMWLEYQARLACFEKSIPFHEDMLDTSLSVPPQLDFRMG